MDTVNDNMDGVKQGTLQNTGDNVLELTKALANADEIDKIEVCFLKYLLEKKYC